MSIYYDPMISKFAVYGKDRNEAIERMRRALMEYEVGGIKTTLPFFRRVMNDEVFISGNLDTGFIKSFLERTASGDATAISDPDLSVIAAALSSMESAIIQPSPPQTLSNWVRSARAT